MSGPAKLTIITASRYTKQEFIPTESDSFIGLVDSAFIRLFSFIRLNEDADLPQLFVLFMPSSQAKVSLVLSQVDQEVR